MITPPFEPPMPPFAPKDIGGLRLLTRLSRNGFSAFPETCLNAPVTRMPILRSALFVVSDSAAIVEMLQTRSEDFARVPAGRRVMGPITGRGLLTSEGAPWRSQRRAMASAFAPRTLPVMAAQVVRVAERALASLAPTCPIDLLSEMQALSLNIAAASMFSLESACFQAELKAHLGAYLGGLGRPRPQDFLLPEWVPTPLTLHRRAFRRTWTRLIGEVVAARRKQKHAGDERDLFDLLAAAHGEENEALLVDEVATMLVAGHETTGLTLFWALYLLAHAPDWRAAIQAEVADADLAPEIAVKTLDSLKVTRAVINETLRLYSPAFLTARVAVRATEVAGVATPKGALMLAPIWLAHRNPRRWADPTRFDPTRFLSAPAPDRDSFLPFGAGPRVCIGSQLAMTETVLGLALILRRWSPRLVAPHRPVLPVAVLSTRPDHAPLFHLDAA